MAHPVLLRLHDVKTRVGLSRSQIYLLISEKKFPQQIHIGERAVAWIDSEIEKWIQDRIQETRDSVENV